MRWDVYEAGTGNAKSLSPRLALTAVIYQKNVNLSTEQDIVISGKFFFEWGSVLNTVR